MSSGYHMGQHRCSTCPGAGWRRDEFCPVVYGRLKGLRSLPSPAAHFVHPLLLIEGMWRWIRQAFAFRDLQASWANSTLSAFIVTLWGSVTLVKGEQSLGKCGFWEAWLQALGQIFLLWSIIPSSFPTMELEHLELHRPIQPHTDGYLSLLKLSWEFTSSSPVRFK